MCMMTERNTKEAVARGPAKLRELVDRIRRRLKRHKGELEPEGSRAVEAPNKPDPVIQAGQESFPASDPPSFTPGKST